MFIAAVQNQLFVTCRCWRVDFAGVADLAVPKGEAISDLALAGVTFDIVAAAELTNKVEGNLLVLADPILGGGNFSVFGKWDSFVNIPAVLTLACWRVTYFTCTQESSWSHLQAPTTLRGPSGYRLRMPLSLYRVVATYLSPLLISATPQFKVAQLC